MFITQPRNCALIGSIPSGIFEGDGSVLPKTSGHSASDYGGTKLVGHFNPNDTGNVSGSTYNNLASGEMDLAIYNGMSYTTGFVNGAGFHSETSGVILDGKPIFAEDYRLVRYFESDGTDDFLGPMLSFFEAYDDVPDIQETGLYLNAGEGPNSDGLGGYQDDGWAMCMWVNFPQQAWSGLLEGEEGAGSVLFSCGAEETIDDRSTRAHAHQTGFAYDFGQGATSAGTRTFIKPIEADRWYFVAYQNQGHRNLTYTDEGITIAVDGKVLPLKHELDSSLYKRGEANPIYIGAKYEEQQVGSDVFARSYVSSQLGTKFGMMFLYSGEIGINRIIQNYVATRENYNRHSGEKNAYFAEDPTDTYQY
jgi:hypothetical protein